MKTALLARRIAGRLARACRFPYLSFRPSAATEESGLQSSKACHRLYHCPALGKLRDTPSPNQRGEHYRDPDPRNGDSPRMINGESPRES